MHAGKQDWHHADIIAALRKKGTSLAALSRRAGLCSATLANALSRPWPKGEWLIAEALNIHPAEIWPSRYYDPVTQRLLDRKKLIRTTTRVPKAKTATPPAGNSDPCAEKRGPLPEDWRSLAESPSLATDDSISSVADKVPSAESGTPCAEVSLSPEEVRAPAVETAPPAIESPGPSAEETNLF